MFTEKWPTFLLILHKSHQPFQVKDSKPKRKSKGSKVKGKASFRRGVKKQDKEKSKKPKRWNGEGASEVGSQILFNQLYALKCFSAQQIQKFFIQNTSRGWKALIRYMVNIR